LTVGDGWPPLCRDAGKEPDLLVEQEALIHSGEADWMAISMTR
jgi:hypothetical protein